ncbi:MAG: phosphoglucomutase/phosphomannomutase family protein [Dehalococcoidaceae bacterium]|nr:phosphoglucomutase/phosphomannomutase family protein [Dehalococcoidaceae bacterium]
MDKKNSSSIKFGTDGWRGIIAEDFTFENLRLCSQATADFIKGQNNPDPLVVVGYDTRFASADFARAAAEVMAANDIRVLINSSPCPTPVVSHATKTYQASAGIVITASHNPARWSGYKIKSGDGSSAPAGIIQAIETGIENLERSNIKRLDFEYGLKSGLIQKEDFAPHYLEKLGSLVDIDQLKKAPLKVVFDAMFGAGSGYLSRILEGEQLGIIEINAGLNPAFPGIKQPEPIGPNLQKLAAAVRETGACAGLATDGDADRLGIIDEQGRFLNTLQVYSLLVLYLLEIRGQRGAVVKTITSSSMIQRLGEIYNVPVYEVPVGFKHVAPVMVEHDALAGGEESGGYGYRGHIPERDGILSALFFLDYMVKTGKNPSQLVQYLYSLVGPHYYERADYEFPAEQREHIINRVSDFKPSSIDGRHIAKIDTFDGFRYTLSDRSWLLIRFSGTEPLLRIYAEGSTPEQVARLLDEGKRIAGL